MNKIVVEWVPSHVGITGNESADSLAKNSLQLPNVNSISKSTLELRRLTKQNLREKWQREWNSLPSELTRFKPKLSDTAFANRPRYQQVPLTRLRLKTTILTHEHIFKKRPPEKCTECQTRLTLTHLMIECHKYKPQRERILKYCQEHKIEVTLENITSPQFPTELIIKFLTDTETLKSI